MRKLIIAILIFNQLSVNAYSNMQAIKDASNLEMQLQQQAQTALQQGRNDYSYGYGSNPGYMQLLDQAQQAGDLEDHLRQQQNMGDDDNDY